MCTQRSSCLLLSSSLDDRLTPRWNWTLPSQTSFFGTSRQNCTVVPSSPFILWLLFSRSFPCRFPRRPSLSKLRLFLFLLATSLCWVHVLFLFERHLLAHSTTLIAGDSPFYRPRMFICSSVAIQSTSFLTNHTSTEPMLVEDHDHLQWPHSQQF